MHWLETWRRENSYSQDDLARAVDVTPALIDLLENRADCVTHVNIANRIVDFTGATIEQRDSIVHKKHRGTWQPDPKRRPRKKKKSDPRENLTHNSRIVIVLNTAGASMGIFPTERSAAAAVGCTQMTVHNRCTRRAQVTTNEFSTYGVTFRFADEWFNMTPEQQITDMRRAASIRKKKKEKTS